MLRILALIFRCRHERISWPQSGVVQCHDCHKRLKYDWDAMQIRPERPSRRVRAITTMEAE